MTLLEDFKLFLKDTNGLVIWALGGGLFGAVAAKFVGISPPWPSSGTALTCAALLLALMRVFLNHRTISKINAVRKFRLSNIFLILSTIFYLISFSLFVYPNTKGESIVSGFVCTPSARSIYDNCPFLSSDEIAQAGYEADQLWTQESITANEVSLFMLWVSAFCLFINSVGLFVIYARKIKR